MINRQDCYTALFTLKDAGIDISKQLELMKNSRGVPRGVIEFLRDNSPQFQFYRHIQQHQKALSKSLRNYENLNEIDKLITASSFLTRAMIAVKYKNLDESLLDDLNIAEVAQALDTAITEKDFEMLDNVLCKHRDSLKVFYLKQEGKS